MNDYIWSMPEADQDSEETSRRLFDQISMSDCAVQRARGRGMRSERSIQKGPFRKVHSAFESWQVFRHMNLYVE
jgi:hypothetical protein